MGNKVNKNNKSGVEEKKVGDLFDDSDMDTSDNDSSDENAKSKARVYNKTKWKKKLKALEKTKVVIETGKFKSVEAYLIHQQKQRNAELNLKRQMTKKKVKAQQKKERKRKQDE